MTTAFELRIRRLGQTLGLRHEGRERPVLLKARGRLDVDRIAFVGIFVEHLSFEPIGIGSEPVAQRARGGSGRRADAPHQRQRAPERQPPSALVRTRALDDAEAVIEHGIVECAGELR